MCFYSRMEQINETVARICVGDSHSKRSKKR